MTHAARHKIIQDMSKILHTLLLAGYETTALSLSYAMYCLAMSPRCQERCCEEAVDGSPSSSAIATYLGAVAIARSRGTNTDVISLCRSLQSNRFDRYRRKGGGWTW